MKLSHLKQTLAEHPNAVYRVGKKKGAVYMIEALIPDKNGDAEWTEIGGMGKKGDALSVAVLLTTARELVTIADACDHETHQLHHPPNSRLTLAVKGLKAKILTYEPGA